MKRPATIERASTLGRRAPSLAETSPYRRTTGSIVIDEAELAATIEAELAATNLVEKASPDDLASTAPRASTSGGEITAPSAFGPYLVYEKLGEGGMACVHRAELVGSAGLRKQVALKRLHTDASEDPSLVDAFVHEAQLAAKLHHPNIAQAYELGKIEDTYFIAMELVPGPTLLQIMNQAHHGAGAVPVPIALEVLTQIADALDHVHDLRDDGGSPLNLIHRDVSPANIIISRTGQAKLIDFGIAKARSARHNTQAGYIKGKHGYIAPEYTYGQLDYRADLFALGVVAHELLTGRRLFSADTELETLRNVRQMAIQPPSRYRAGISPELDAIVLRALDRDPDKRWQSAGAIRDAFSEEAHRIGVAISGPQIRDWVEWAFNQNARRDSSVERMLRGMSPSLSIEMAEVEIVPTPRPSTPIPVIVEPPDAPDADVSEEMPTVDLSAPKQPPTGPSDDELPTVDRSPSSPVRRLAHTASEVSFLPATTMASLLSTRAATPADAIARRAATPPFVAKPIEGRPELPLPAPREDKPARSRARAPHWRAPTRWVKPQRRRSPVPAMILLALLAFALIAADQGLIDIEGWREILGA
jgi:serine/threonine protein kinase